MPRRWVRERRKDPYYRKAKREGYRSRASYKLLQIEERFQVIAEGDRVVDLGAAPGGWSQVAVELVGEEGRVVGIDLAPIEPMEGAVFLRGDMTDAIVVDRVKEAAGGPVDAVISDMSPNISGAYEIDHARSVALSETALAFAGGVLRNGGNFVCKVFGGDMLQSYVAKVRAEFAEVKVHSPAASRSSSSEVYVVARGFHRKPRRRVAGAIRATDEDAEAEPASAAADDKADPAKGSARRSPWREGMPVGDYGTAKRPKR
ncbi:MAG: RlmE family RNA methyltransferase [Thermoplasmatota archaeon]